MSEASSPYPTYDIDAFEAGIARECAFAVTEADIQRFAEASGDLHPLHVDSAFSQRRGYPSVLVHGMCVAARCSAFVARAFVGTRGLLVSMSADFRLPIFCGEQLTWRGVATRVTPSAGTVEIDWQVSNSKRLLVQRGTACAWLPTK